nr:GMC oxidoreductase [Arboricoccus pini]
MCADAGRPSQGRWVSADTTYHPLGTCKIERSAVRGRRSPQGRRRRGLRAKDASIMPRIVSANTDAATFKIGEEAAGLIKSGLTLPSVLPAPRELT